MADFILTVGIDEALSYDEMRKGLERVINKLDHDGHKIKLGFDKQIGEALERLNRTAEQTAAPLQEIVRLVGELNQKPFALNLDISEANTAQEALGRYRESVRDYVREMREAYEAVGRITNSSKWKSEVGQSMNQQLAALNGADYLKNIKELENRLERVSSFAGAERIAKDAQSAWNTVMPILQKAQEIGILSRDSTFGVFPEIPQQSMDTATKLADLLGQIGGRAQETGQALDAEAAQTQESTSQFDAHGAAVEAAAEAEKQKQANAASLSGALADEAAALREVEAAAGGAAGGTEAAAEAAQASAAATEQEAAASRDAADAGAAHDRAVRDVASAQRAVESALTQGTKRLGDWHAAQRSVNSDSREAYAQLQREVDGLRDVATGLQNGTVSADHARDAMTHYRTALQQIERTLQANGDATQTLTQRFGKLTSKFSAWLGASQLIMLAVRAFKQGVKAAIELDDAFAQLQIVTGATEQQMEAFKDTAAELANSIGRSVSEVAKSIETFTRLGYALDDAKELARYASVLANTAAVDTETATTGITSIIKGFGMDVSNTEHVADVLIEVGQKYAVSAGELMDAYEHAGAALSATNTSFEKSAGLLAAANAAVQNSSTVGTALKTISARIRGSKSDLASLGEDPEELANGFSKYAKELKALTGFDIMVEGTTDSFKDLYDIMNGIADVWDRLSDTQRARVSEILGGTRQLQVISSILGNWKDAAGAYEAAINSAGAATRANNIYMETATAHINIFKAAFQTLSSDMSDNNGLITKIVDLGTAILRLADALTKAKAFLPAAATVISLFKTLGGPRAKGSNCAQVSFAREGSIPYRRGRSECAA